MSLPYHVKLEVFIAHVLRLSCQKNNSSTFHCLLSAANLHITTLETFSADVELCYIRKQNR